MLPLYKPEDFKRVLETALLVAGDPLPLAELKKQVESAGFGNVTFSTVYEIKKKINGEEKTFPVFLMSARKI